MPTCKIVYVKQSGEIGWRWHGVTADGTRRTSTESYPLFYECVLAARASGFTPHPALKCA
jgi:hypothetical protein